MTYRMNGYGSFYAFQPHQIYPPGYGPGLGAANIRKTFNARQVWADASLGATIGAEIERYEDVGCTVPPDPNNPVCQVMWQNQGRINVAGARAATAIQEGLNELGYGPIAVDGDWGSESIAAWKAFAADHPVAGKTGFPTKPGVDKMGELLAGGYHRAGIFGKIGLPLIAVGVLGGLAYMFVKKRKG